MIWIIFALISALFLSFTSLCQKKVLNKEHALQTIVSVTFIAALTSTLFIREVTLNISFKVFFLLYAKSVLLAFSWVMMFKALRHMEISKVEPLKNISPLFMAIFAFMLLGERMTIFNFFGVLVIMVGAYIIQVDHSFSHVIENLKILKNKHIYKLFISLFLTTLSGIIDKVLVADYKINTFTILFFVYWMIFINLFLVFSYKYNGYHGVAHALQRRHVWIVLAAVLKITSEISYFYAISLPGVLISLVIPIKRMSTLFSTIIGGEMFHDHGMKMRVIGCSVALVGCILVVVPW